MTQKSSIAQIFLWLFVVMLGIEIGAGLYETIVIVPMWAGSPPDSVVAFYQHNAANPQMTINAGGKFWIFATPLVGLLSITVLLTGKWANSEQRRLRTIGSGLALLVVISTFVWFVPNIILLQSKEVLTMDANKLASLANWWFTLNWVRCFLYVTAWVTALHSLTITPQQNLE